MTHGDAPPLARILVVDDNEDVRDLLHYVLSSRGYHVTLAASGEEALDQCNRQPFELLMVDVMMPGIGGFELAIRLRSLPAWKQVPLIFLTALGDLGTQERAAQAGADDFLCKPVSPTELALRVRTVLAVRKLQIEVLQFQGVVRDQMGALLRAERQRKHLMEMLAHDLRSPLMAMILGMEAAQEALLREPEQVGQLIREALVAADTMQRMITDTLDVELNEDGGLLPRLVEIDAVGLLRDLAASMNTRAAEAAIHIQVEVEAVHLAADRSLLARALANLLENALRYAPPNSVVRLCAHRVDSSVALEVLDQGPGVPAPLRERIFDKHIRVERPDAQRANRGLGLSFCRAVAIAHRGSIRVANHPSGWTCFQLLLPVD